MDDWYQQQFDKALTTEFDAEFKKITDLTWLPWVGKNFDACKILIVAESHYTNTDDPTLVQQKKQQYLDEDFATREVMAEYPLYGYEAGWKNNGGRSNNPTFDNLFRLLISDALLYGENILERRLKLCSNFAFMNMIQRPMWYPPASTGFAKERPNDEDRKVGWDVVAGVLKILTPDICIFSGSDASRYFEYHMNRLGINYSNWEWAADKIGNTYPKKTIIDIGGKTIPLKFIRHPGSYFCWEQWQEFVFSDCRDIQDKLLSVMKE